MDQSMTFSMGCALSPYPHQEIFIHICFAETVMAPEGLKDRGQTLACLIIDDLLLKPRYGCLEYEILLQKMKEHHFFSEIAFIPWNYRRSDPKTIRLFADNPEYFGICIHGCNHTHNEFGDSNYEKLKSLAALALARMEEHKRITGLSYDPVMVFPQGRFSSMAMRALKSQGFHSAFNSSLRTVDGEEVAATEYERPATYIYHNLPLFMRRYPQEKSNILKDIAWGRPIILVEHHGIFKNGYQELLKTIDWINERGNIIWKSLGYITEYYCGKKPDTVHGKNAALKREKVKERTRIALRRIACEVRDNYIEPSHFLTGLYRTVQRVIKKSPL